MRIRPFGLKIRLARVRCWKQSLVHWAPPDPADAGYSRAEGQAMYTNLVVAVNSGRLLIDY